MINGLLATCKISFFANNFFYHNVCSVLCISFISKETMNFFFLTISLLLMLICFSPLYPLLKIINSLFFTTHLKCIFIIIFKCPIKPILQIHIYNFLLIEFIYFICSDSVKMKFFLLLYNLLINMHKITYSFFQHPSGLIRNSPSYHYNSFHYTSPEKPSNPAKYTLFAPNSFNIFNIIAPAESCVSGECNDPEKVHNLYL